MLSGEGAVSFDCAAAFPAGELAAPNEPAMVVPAAGRPWSSEVTENCGNGVLLDAGGMDEVADQDDDSDDPDAVGLRTPVGLVGVEVLDMAISSACVRDGAELPR